MIKDILVNLSLGERGGFAGEYAISIATAFEAHVAGIAFLYDPVIPLSGAGYIPADDNVLVGDYQQLTPSPRPFATGGPLVHIRAVPEGGPVGSLVGTSLPYTFYDRYTAGLPSRTTDRRQPLPSTFAALWISGGTDSKLVLWREGLTAGSCSGLATALGNGCSPAPDYAYKASIGPAPNPTP